MDLIRASRELTRATERLTFGSPVTHVYNPLVYARAPHEAYLERWGQGPKSVILLGMNPGPFGMAQTGVPFGDVALVRDWLGISGAVTKPALEHPKRPVLGFECSRSEVSGARLWGWARDRFGTPERFFAQFFVVNYCPLAFMEESSKNRTPDKLPASEREPLFEACDEALRRIVRAVGAKHVIGIGAFAEQRARAALADQGLAFGGVLHPSPASPLANRGWAGVAERQLAEHGIRLALP
jgi:single-strand selective monofunctional uracil DNA glycosylase